MFDLSNTVIEYVPAFSVITFLPSFFSVIVKPGPTVPVSFGSAACEGAAIASTPVRAASRMVMRKRLKVPPSGESPGTARIEGTCESGKWQPACGGGRPSIPAWTPADGGPDGWEQEVGCVYYEAPGAVVLIDPLVPMEDRDRFFRALDRDVERAGLPVRVLVTVDEHKRSSAELAERYGGTVGELPEGVEIAVSTVDERVYLDSRARGARLRRHRRGRDGGLA